MTQGDLTSVGLPEGAGGEPAAVPRTVASAASRASGASGASGASAGSLSRDVHLLLEDMEQDDAGGGDGGREDSTPSPVATTAAPQQADEGQEDDRDDTGSKKDVTNSDSNGWTFESANSGDSVYAQAVRRARNAFATGRTLPFEFRRQQLLNFQRFLEENEEALLAALYADLRKSSQEGVLFDLMVVENEIRHVLFEFKEWMKPEKPTRAPVNWFDGVVIRKEPLGVVLVLGTWNYPMHLTLLPVAGAIAAGNCVVIKPPDLVPECARVMAELLPRYLDKDCVQVLLGGIPETTEILRQKFDHIFYTGSANVGRIVHAAANQYLTPVTLELGGKSPVWLGASADMLTATRRLLWGKFTNAGQTCVAPDYLLCTREVRDEFLGVAKRVILEFYGADPKASPDLGRMVSDRQFQRVSQLLKCGKVAIGGDVDRADLYVGPTVLVDVLPDDPVMAEEVFGPLLPVYTVAGPTEAVNFVNSRDKPLALYVFTKDPAERDLFLANTSSGGVSVNDTMLHLCTEGLPFGGVGLSGMGAYHGKYSFETFSHRKSVLTKNFNPVLEAVSAGRYPPYSRNKTLLLRTLMLKRRSPPWRALAYAGVFSLGMAFTWLLNLLTASMEPPGTTAAAAAATSDT